MAECQSHGGWAALGVRRRVRQVGRACHVQPLALVGDRQPGLIKMRDRCGLHAAFDRHLDFCQGCRTSLRRGAERAGREALPKEIGKNFAGARLRQQLIIAQVDGDSLRDVRDGGMKGRWLARLTVTTGLVGAAMFGHRQAQHRQLKDLAACIPGGRLGEQIPSAAHAVCEPVRLDVIRVSADGPVAFLPLRAADCCCASCVPRGVPVP